MTFYRFMEVLNCHKHSPCGSEQPQEVSEMLEVNMCGGQLAQHVGNIYCVTHPGYRKQTLTVVQQDRITTYFNHMVVHALNATPQSVTWHKHINNLPSKKSGSCIIDFSHIMYI